MDDLAICERFGIRPFAAETFDQHTEQQKAVLRAYMHITRTDAADAAADAGRGLA